MTDDAWKAVPAASPRLLRLLRQAVQDFEALTDEEKARQLELQRQSWLRGEMALGLEDSTE